jgi:hypothetical protein
MKLGKIQLKTRLTVTLAIITISAAVVVVAIANNLNPGPAQPIPFSHRIHAGTKDISCFFCHPRATVSSNPSLPPVEKCLLCHKVIASNFKPIANVRGYYSRKEPIPWVRVSMVPDFVHFSHQPHLARGFDCGECHGNVKAMDRIKPVHDFQMGFCVDCHWKNNFSVSCYTCHY